MPLEGIDAPIAHHLDLPSQARSKQDTAKKFDGTCFCQSKLQGVLDAGMHANALTHVADSR